MKVVINKCYGGFSLSPKAVKRLAELQGRECYFFNLPLGGEPRKQLTIKEAEQTVIWTAFDTLNPPCRSMDEWTKMTLAERIAYNERYAARQIVDREIKRNDPLLIQVVEELGSGHRTGASGKCAELAIVEIPDDVKFVIEEYDGMEWVAEEHRTWS